jgi:hypothetical protein
MEYSGSAARARSIATLASAPSPACQAVKASSDAGAGTYGSHACRTTSIHSRRCAARCLGSIRAQASSRTRRSATVTVSQASWSRSVIWPPRR